jgi:imidazoleglycerol-phosphate dehydratase
LRKSEYVRETRETQITVKVNLDGTGDTKIDTGIRYFDHLIRSLATHSMIDMTIDAQGDLKHHIIEDIAICLGGALRKALGDGVGIRRFGYAMVPMDGSLAVAVVDLVQRTYSKLDLKISGERIEDTLTEDIQHFFETLTSSLQCNLHLWVEYGVNDHHKAEAAVKALALSLKQAVSYDPRRREVPSAKGTM